MSFVSAEFVESARKNASCVALIDEAGRSWTYDQLADEVDRLAPRISSEIPGRVVGILLLNSQRFLVTMLAIWRAGKVAVPLNYLLPPEDLAFILKDSGMGGLVSSTFFEEALGKIRPLFGDKGTILMADDQSFIPASGGAEALEPRDPALYLYTSGTTGRPKGVVLSHRNLISNVRSCETAGDFSSGDTFLCLLPFFHTYAITGTFLLPILNGSTMVLVDRFQPAKVLKLVADHRVTCFLAIPSMYRVLATTEGEFDVSSLRFPISGGEPLPAAVAESFETRFGVSVFEGYGQTEASPVVSLNVPGARRPGTVGRPLPGVEVCVWNDAGEPVPPGVVGELMVRGDNVMHGYHNLADETAQTISGGWLHTGDLGTMDEDGFIRITGRKTDLIISAGENIFPREIEEALIEHPSVREVVVVGVPDEVRGEVPRAFVVPAEGRTLDEKDLRRFCKARIAGYKVPKTFAIVDDLPRNASGKVLKRELG
jgi:long-chain acyl-CoA synthetase